VEKVAGGLGAERPLEFMTNTIASYDVVTSRSISMEEVASPLTSTVNTW
jgi:hypothetical protein